MIAGLRAGNVGITELISETKRFLNGKRKARNSVFERRIAFNAIPKIGGITRNLYSEEEMKLHNESRKILSDNKILISATTVRVPIVRSHSISLNIEFNKDVPLAKARKALNGFAGIKNININSSRIGVIKILNKMGAKIQFENFKIMNGERCSDIKVKSIKNLKGINCPVSLNSAAIDEFLIIFLVAAKSKGISYFKDLSELNQKESPRLTIAAKILKMMGVRLKYDSSSIKIYGNPNLKLSKNIIIKNFLKDHRVFMMSVIAALSFGGKWKIFDPDSVKTSFPSFFLKIKEIGAKIK